MLSHGPHQVPELLVPGVRGQDVEPILRLLQGELGAGDVQLGPFAVERGLFANDTAAGTTEELEAPLGHGQLPLGDIDLAFRLAFLAREEVVAVTGVIDFGILPRQLGILVIGLGALGRDPLVDELIGQGRRVELGNDIPLLHGGALGNDLHDGCHGVDVGTDPPGACGRRLALPGGSADRPSGISPAAPAVLEGCWAPTRSPYPASPTSTIPAAAIPPSLIIVVLPIIPWTSDPSAPETTRIRHRTGREPNRRPDRRLHQLGRRLREPADRLDPDGQRRQPAPRQSPPQQVPRPRQPAADGAQRAAQLRRGLLLRQALPVAEQHDDAVLLGQPPHFLLHDRAEFVAVDVVGVGLDGLDDPQAPPVPRRSAAAPPRPVARAATRQATP